MKWVISLDTRLWLKFQMLLSLYMVLMKFIVHWASGLNQTSPLKPASHKGLTKDNQ